VPIAALLEAEYSRERRAMIDPLHAADGLPQPGRVSGAAWPKPWNWPGERHGERMPVLEDETVMDTSYLCAVDRWGNAFSATPSDGNATAPIVCTDNSLLTDVAVKSGGAAPKGATRPSIHNGSQFA